LVEILTSDQHLILLVVILKPAVSHAISAIIVCHSESGAAKILF